MIYKLSDIPHRLPRTISTSSSKTAGDSSFFRDHQVGQAANTLKPQNALLKYKQIELLHIIFFEIMLTLAIIQNLT